MNEQQDITLQIINLQQVLLNKQILYIQHTKDIIKAELGNQENNKALVRSIQCQYMMEWGEIRMLHNNQCEYSEQMLQQYLQNSPLEQLHKKVGDKHIRQTRELEHRHQLEMVNCIKKILQKY